MDRLYLFNPKFDNEELEEKFQEFFYNNGLTPLFTFEHKAGEISVTYLDAKSVVNEGGSYAETLKEFADLLLVANDNKSYDEALFKIIRESNSFQAMMRKIRERIEYIKTFEEQYIHNTWNIVWYTKELK